MTDEGAALPDGSPESQLREYLIASHGQNNGGSGGFKKDYDKTKELLENYIKNSEGNVVQMPKKVFSAPTRAKRRVLSKAA